MASENGKPPLRYGWALGIDAGIPMAEALARGAMRPHPVEGSCLLTGRARVYTAANIPQQVSE